MRAETKGWHDMAVTVYAKTLSDASIGRRFKYEGQTYMIKDFDRSEKYVILGCKEEGNETGEFCYHIPPDMMIEMIP